MSRRMPVLLLALGFAAALAPTAHAASHIIGQQSTKNYAGTVYLSRSLHPGHTYRIDVLSSSRKSFQGNGIETYVGVSRGRLGTGSKSLSLQGSTPRSFKVTQPVPGSLSTWLLAVQVQIRTGYGLTVRFVDLGKRK